MARTADPVEKEIEAPAEKKDEVARRPGGAPPDPGDLSPPKRPLYKRRPFQIGAALVLLLGLVWGVRSYLYSRSHESTDDAFVDGQVIQISPKVSAHVVSVYVSDNQQVKKGDLLAELDPADFQAKLNQAKAALAEAEARQGAAQSNVTLTRASTNAGVQQARSGVDAAQSQVAGAREQVRVAQERVAQAGASVKTARAAAEQARAQLAASQAEATRAAKDLERYRVLLEKDEVTRQEYDRVVAQESTAQAQVEAARARITAAEAQVNEAQAAEAAARAALGQAQAGVQTAQAGVGEATGRLAAANTAPEQVAVSESQVTTVGATIEQARAAIAEAELQLSYTKIFAPEDGKVTNKAFNVGQLVQTGQPLMALVTGDLWVTANFKETQLDEIRPGQPAEITVDAYPGKTFKGHVESIQSGSGAAFSLLPPENATGNFVKVVQRVPVKIVFDETPDPQFALGPGMSAVPEVSVK